MAESAGSLAIVPHPALALLVAPGGLARSDVGPRVVQGEVLPSPRARPERTPYFGPRPLRGPSIRVEVHPRHVRDAYEGLGRYRSAGRMHVDLFV